MMSGMNTKRVDLAKRIRDACKRSGLSGYMLAKRSGLAVSIIQEFLSGRDIRLATASKLCDVLNLDLIERKGGGDA